jgi:membrane protein insertase Oxa1/YidC/SpoIIIJ
MEEEWDHRIQPILDLLTETSGRIDSIEKEMVRTNQKVNTTLDYFMRSQDMDASRTFILPGTSFKFISKILVLIFFTFSALVYVSSYPLGIVHYFILAIYLTWWGFITAEFKLFSNSTAWTWAIAPILIIPAVGIIMSAIYGLNIMIGILFLALLLYVYFYYSWASFYATGYKLIDLKPVIREIIEKIKKNKPSSIEVDEIKGLKK